MCEDAFHAKGACNCCAKRFRRTATLLALQPRPAVSSRRVGELPSACVGFPGASWALPTGLEAVEAEKGVCRSALCGHIADHLTSIAQHSTSFAAIRARKQPASLPAVSRKVSGQKLKIF